MLSPSPRTAIAIVCLGILLRILFAVLTPTWDAPDEYPHYWVVERIAVEGGLPRSEPVFPRYEAFQPPLYYVAAGGLLAAIGPRPASMTFDREGSAPSSTLIILRLLSVLCGALTLVVVWRTVADRPSMSRAEKLTALAFVAFLPSYVGITSTVNNDAAVVLLAALAFHAALAAPGGGGAFRAGLFTGLALLAKSSAVVVVPFFLMYYWCSGHGTDRTEGTDRSGGDRWQSLWRYGAGAAIGVGLRRRLLRYGAGAAIGVGLLLARNIIQYDALLAVMPGVEREAALDPANVAHAVRNLFGSFWLAFGRLYTVHPPFLFYLLTFVPMTIAAAAGYLRSRAQRPLPLGLLTVTFACAVLLSLAFTLSYPAGTMTSWGKNLYPLLPLFAIVAGVGWNRVIGRRHVVAWMSIAVMVGGLAWIVGVFRGLL